MAEAADRGRFVEGFSAAVFCNLVGLLVAVAMMSSVIGGSALGGFGIVQLLWLIPVWRSYRKQGKTENAKGVLLVVGITILLNAACWGSVRKYGISG